MMITLLLLLRLSFAQCEVNAAPDAAYTLTGPDPSTTTFVHLELWVDDPTSPWSKAMLEVLQSEGVHSNLALSLPETYWNTEQVEAIRQFAELGHGIALRRSGIELSVEEGEHLRQLSRQLKRDATRPRAIVSPIMKRGVEPELVRLGFSSIIPTNNPLTSIARYAVVGPGRPPLAVAIPPGRYRSDCVNPTVAKPLSPDTLDRATRAVHASYSKSGASVIRVVLVESLGRESDDKVLKRWLEGPMAGWQSQFVTSRELRPKILIFLRQGSPESVDHLKGSGGKIVPIDALNQAANELQNARRIPSELADGRLNPTEAFAGFLRLLNDDMMSDGVKLAVLSGPATAAKSSLSGPREVSRVDLMVSVRSLVNNLPETIPSAFRVGSLLLTADEYLTLLANAVATEAPLLTVRPVETNDPGSPGIGWGKATLQD